MDKVWVGAGEQVWLFKQKSSRAVKHRGGVFSLCVSLITLIWMHTCKNRGGRRLTFGHGDRACNLLAEVSNSQAIRISPVKHYPPTVLFFKKLSGFHIPGGWQSPWKTQLFSSEGSVLMDCTCLWVISTSSNRKMLPILSSLFPTT